MISALDKIGAGLSRVTRGRFQWPLWLIKFAWDWQAQAQGPSHPNDRGFSSCVHRWLKRARR